MRLAFGYLRSRPGRTAALVAGIAAATTAATVLGIQAAVPTVRVAGGLPASAPGRDYEILVQAPDASAQDSDGASFTRSAGVAGLAAPGGISIAQYDTISRLTGVQVAAPMTLVGYVPLTVVVPVAVPADVNVSPARVLTVTASPRSADGLNSPTQRNVGSTYVVTGACPEQVPEPMPSAVLAAGAVPTTACWSTTNGPQPQAWGGSPPASLSVPLSWTFMLPLIAVDPGAEAKLDHLDHAVTKDSYLPAGPSASGPVPVLVANSIDDSDEDDISLGVLPTGATGDSAGLTQSMVDEVLTSATGRTVATTTVSAARAYASLLDELRRSTASVPVYWPASQASYGRAENGDLVSRPVAEGTPLSSPGAALRVVGEFDPAKVPSSPVTPSPYRSEQLPGADVRSRLLLNNQPVESGRDPVVAYPSPGAALVMPLQDIGAFTSGTVGSYTDATETAVLGPIGSIRVRVRGVTGNDAVSRERVRVVSEEIVRATGLHVEVTLGATPVVRTIDVPTGPQGTPVLRLSEVWYRNDTSTTVGVRVDPRGAGLAALVLLVAVALVFDSVRAELRTRRRDLVTLRALGWPRRGLAANLARDYAVMGIAAGLPAAAATAIIQAALGSRLPAFLALTSVPAALAVTAAGAWWPGGRGLARAEPDMVTSVGESAGWQVPGADTRPRRSVSAPRLFAEAARDLRRSADRTVIGASVTAVACAAFGLELSLRWTFGGMVVLDWLGVPVSFQAGTTDLAAVLTVLVLATVTMADIYWLTVGDRVRELRTLRAIGWPARGVARLIAVEAVLIGMAGGGTASVVVAAASFAVAHRLAISVLAAAATVFGIGVLVSTLAAALSSMARRGAVSKSYLPSE